MKYSAYETPDSDADQAYVITPFPGYFILGTFTGELRDTDETNITFYQGVLNSVGSTQNATEIFNKEAHIQFDEKSIWVPIQSSFLEDWKTEIQKAALVGLFIRIHMFFPKEKRFILTVSDFTSDPKSALQEITYNHIWKNTSISMEAGQKLINLWPNDGDNYSLIAYAFVHAMHSSSNSNGKMMSREVNRLFNTAEELGVSFPDHYFFKAEYLYYIGEYHEAWKNIDLGKKIEPNLDNQSLIKSLEEVYPRSTYEAGKN